LKSYTFCFINDQDYMRSKLNWYLIMNTCVEHHKPKFRITYKPAKAGGIRPVWLVCDICMQNKHYFGSEDEIEKVELLA
jgi:hypothetical protein